MRTESIRRFGFRLAAVLFGAALPSAITPSLSPCAYTSMPATLISGPLPSGRSALRRRPGEISDYAA